MINPEEFDPTIREVFEEALSQSSEQHYVLRLYIAGTTYQSVKALQNLKQICEEHLKGRYELEVIDIYQDMELTSSQNIVAVPTLIKELPPPIQRLIGNLSNTEKVLVGLDIIPKKTTGGRNNDEFTEFV
ncbi:circadian oscillation regulator KaiB [Geminocystis sp. NIES-3708]|uniref:circadian clock KaiB family protein n=1 Tax=Geminocystis sp. NIES-3708 TaxID=1615909 RepID=UPI0005FC426D|nr:circadian clock KaiB family protein [Geminocystis sp. NIES-3708]BAQ62477.1 circadian oscillation regulator KaiB [Geminocystis sp. NIES-3708]